MQFILKRISSIMSLIVFTFFILSCATSSQNTGKSKRQNIERQTPHVATFKPVNERKVLQKIAQFEKVLNTRPKNLTQSDLKLHDELLEAYIQLKQQENHSTKILVPAKSQMTLDLQSFCLDSGHAIPNDFEVFKWVKRDLKIPYYKELLVRVSKGEVTQEDAQTLFWNLQNKTYWENYPNKLKAILQKIDANVAFKLPSRLKDSAIDFLKSQIPLATEVEEAFFLAEGNYYEYKDFAQSVQDTVSKYPLEPTEELSAIPNTSLYTSIKPDGYNSQKITFYNQTNQSQEIDLADYYLQPYRKDVQRIGVAGQSQPENSNLLARLEKLLYDSMLRLGIGFTPVLGDVADIYELFTGKDFLNGMKLSMPERMLSGVGLIAGSGIGYRHALRMAHAPERAIPKFEQGFKKIANKEIKLGNRQLNEAQNALHLASKTKEAIVKSPTLRKSFEAPNFNKTDFYVRPNGEVIPAQGIRYVATDAPYLQKLIKTGVIPAKTDGNYISFKNFSSIKSAASELQVPHDAGIKIEFDTKQVLNDIKIPNGQYGNADWLEPITRDNPQFGIGGATQAITRKKIRAQRIIDLRTGKILYDRK